MQKVDVEINNITGDKVYKTVLSNGLRVYIHPKKGFVNKMGLFGTLYGSIDNDFVDIITSERKKVPDGIAHFLEHKLFEKEGENVLDVFAKMGVSSNAYTSYDQTVYFFETDKEYNTCLDKLVDFVSTPYFTDENVEKEKGIIGQEIKMYEDEPNAVVYENLMKAMYIKNPIRIDIAGTVESISGVSKELLYTCYNTFYNPKNMFFIAIGDVNVDETIDVLQKSVIKHSAGEKSQQVVKFSEEEPQYIVQKETNKALSVHTPVICIGFKLRKTNGKTNIKNEIMTEFVNEICFSNMSRFYERLYKKKIITHEPTISYESGETFSHLVISSYAEDIEVFEKEIGKYLQELKQNGVDENLFNIVKSKKEGEYIYNLENMTYIYRSIIESIIQKIDVYESQEILKKICIKDINNFICESLDFTKMCISKVVPK